MFRYCFLSCAGLLRNSTIRAACLIAILCFILTYGLIRGTYRKHTPDAPNVIHFVIGLDEAGATNPFHFLFYQYLAIKSARIHGNPDIVKLHYFHKPVGAWFDRSVRYVDDLLKIRNLTREIYGRKLVHFAHRSDVFRLLTLREEGGIFVDLDMIVLRPMNELLKDDFVIGKEGSGGNTLLMSFTVAKKNSFFLQQWIESYRTFVSEQWNYHCCQLPAIMARQYPDDITILDHHATAWPMWNHEGIMEAFFFRTYDYSLNYVTHLWETTTSRFLRTLTAHKIWRLDTSLFCKLRNLTVDEPGAEPDNIEAWASCKVVTKDGADRRQKGLIGRWALRNLTHHVLPRIPDSSGNRMNGLLSPLNGYDLVNQTAVLSERNFFAFRGDHVFLPMLPESSVRNFTLTFWFRMQRMPTDLGVNRSMLTIDFQDAEVVMHLEVVNNGSNLNLTIENIPWKTIEASETLDLEIEALQWYHLAIVGSDGVYTLAVRKRFAKTYSHIKLENDLFVRWHHYALECIWLGRRQPNVPLHYYYNLEHHSDVHFDAADVELQDSAIPLADIISKSSDLTCC